MVDPMKALMFIVLFLVLQQIEGNLIYPHVVEILSACRPSGCWRAVSIGGIPMGVVGMVIFIPIVSVACTVPGNCVSEAEETGSRSGRAGGLLIKTIKSSDHEVLV